MSFTDAFRNDAVDAVALNGGANYYSLHTADPGLTGANEATGGSPAYARELASGFPAASGGSSTNGSVTFDLPAGTYTHWGRWSTASGSTGFYEGGPLPASQTFSTQAQYTLTQTITQPQ